MKNDIPNTTSLVGVLHGNNRYSSKIDVATTKYNNGYVTVGKQHFTNDPLVVEAKVGEPIPEIYHSGDVYPYNTRLVSHLISIPNQTKAVLGGAQLSAADIRTQLEDLDSLMKAREREANAADEILQSLPSPASQSRNAFVNASKIRRVEIDEQTGSLPHVTMKAINGQYLRTTDEYTPLQPTSTTNIADRSQYHKIIRDHKLRSAQQIAAAGCSERLALQNDLFEWIQSHAKREKVEIEAQEATHRKVSKKNKAMRQFSSAGSSSASDATGSPSNSDSDATDEQFTDIESLKRLQEKMAKRDELDIESNRSNDNFETMNEESWSAMGRAVNIVQSSVHGVFDLIKALKSKALSLAEIEARLAQEAAKLSSTKEFVSSALQAASNIQAKRSETYRPGIRNPYGTSTSTSVPTDSQRNNPNDGSSNPQQHQGNIVEVTGDKAKQMFEQRRDLLSRRPLSSNGVDSFGSHNWSDGFDGTYGIDVESTNLSFGGYAHGRESTASSGQYNRVAPPSKSKSKTNQTKLSPGSSSYISKPAESASFETGSDTGTSRRLSEYHFGASDDPLTEYPVKPEKASKKASLALTPHLIMQPNSPYRNHLTAQSASLISPTILKSSKPQSNAKVTIQPTATENLAKNDQLICELKRRCAWQSVAITLLLQVNKKHRTVDKHSASPEATLERKLTMSYLTSADKADEAGTFARSNTAQSRGPLSPKAQQSTEEKVKLLVHVENVVSFSEKPTLIVSQRDMTNANSKAYPQSVADNQAKGGDREPFGSNHLETNINKAVAAFTPTEKGGVCPPKQTDGTLNLLELSNIAWWGNEMEKATTVGARQTFQRIPAPPVSSSAPLTINGYSLNGASQKAETKQVDHRPHSAKLKKVSNPPTKPTTIFSVSPHTNRSPIIKVPPSPHLETF